MGGIAVGVVGLGLGRHFVAANAALESVGRLVVCDPDEARAAEIRAQFPKVTAAYPDLETMIASERLDAVNVVTPDHLHRAQVERCLAAGLHVLQTKPLATTLEDGRAIVRAAEASDRIVMVAHERRFRSLWRAVKGLIDSGRLGEVIHVRSDQVGDRRGQFAKAPWYASAEAGRTALVGSGIHDVDLIRFLVDRPIRTVTAFSNRLGDLDFPEAKTTVALYEFEGGAIGEAMVSYEARWPKAGRRGNAFRLLGTGGIVVDNLVSFVGQDGWEELPDDAQPLVTGIAGCVNAFVRAISEGAPVAIPVRDAFGSLAAAVAADRSAALRQSTRVPGVDED